MCVRACMVDFARVWASSMLQRRLRFAARRDSSKARGSDCFRAKQWTKDSRSSMQIVAKSISITIDKKKTILS